MNMAFISTPAKLVTLQPATKQLSTCATRRGGARVSAKQARVRVTQVPQMSLLPFVPNWLLLAAWGFGAFRFYQGFNQTSYQSSFRIPLSLAWPVLFAVNTAYRQNFIRSIRSGDD